MAQRIFVVDDSQINLKIVVAALAPVGYEVFTAQSGREALQRVEQVQPDLIILDVIMPDLTGYEVCRRMRQRAALRSLPIMMLTANDALEERVDGFEAGADDYMSKPFQVPELQARVKALLRRSRAGPAPAATREAKVIAVYSLRGGAGVSTLAANLAAGLAQLWGAPSVLVDLVLTSGQSALMLNLPLRNTWADLAPLALGDLDTDLLETVLLRHASGARVLAAPARPEQSELITAEKIAHVIGLLKERHEYVVLDLAHDFLEPTLAGLDAADQILLLLPPDLASVRATACALDVFKQLDYPRSSVLLTLNTTFEHGGLARKDIEATLKQPIGLALPFMPDPLVSAINRGVPPVVEMPSKAPGAIFEDMAFFISKDAHRSVQPPSPTEAWQRAVNRQRRARAS